MNTLKQNKHAGWIMPYLGGNGNGFAWDCRGEQFFTPASTICTRHIYLADKNSKPAKPEKALHRKGAKIAKFFRNPFPFNRISLSFATLAVGFF